MSLMSDATPSQLVRACLAGDPAAFEELHARYANAVYRVARRVLTSDDDARDVLQDTFLKAYEMLPTLDEEAAVQAWLLQIAYRRALRVRSHRVPGASDRIDEMVLGEDVAAAAVDTRDFAQAAQIEVERLPERARMVFLLHTVEGLKHPEIAAILDIHEGTSKSQLSYARKLLRERLEGLHRDLLG